VLFGRVEGAEDLPQCFGSEPHPYILDGKPDLVRAIPRCRNRQHPCPLFDAAHRVNSIQEQMQYYLL